jgi:hypothetical protein
MKEEVQRLIMLAIQELHGLPTQSIHSIPVIEDDAQVINLLYNQCCGSRSRQIRMFLSLLDLDPLVRGKDPDPGSFYNEAKIVRKNFDSYCFVTSF